MPSSPTSTLLKKGARVSTNRPTKRANKSKAASLGRLRENDASTMQLLIKVSAEAHDGAHLCIGVHGMMRERKNYGMAKDHA